jgi:tRNA(adenine34) deaminase
MRLALEMAKQDKNEVPVGALIVQKNTLIALRHNEVMHRQNPTAHAEMLVIHDALRILGQMYLTDCTLYVTLEPCPLCAAACAAVRMEHVVFGAYDTKSGGTVHGARVLDHTHHKPLITGGILETESQALLTGFFEGQRPLK